MAEITRKRSAAHLVAAILSALLFVSACGGDESDSAPEDGADQDVRADDESPDSSESAGDVPDACTLLDVEEISAAIGREVGPGEAETTPENTYSCRFETVVGMSTSTTYADPVIPEMFLASVTVSTGSSSDAEFEEFKDLVGDEAEAVTGLGDDAYFWGGNILYIRVGDLGLTIRIEADDADPDAVHAAVLALGELGVSKL